MTLLFLILGTASGCGVAFRNPAKQESASAAANQGAGDSAACVGSETSYSARGSGAVADPYVLCTRAQLLSLMASVTDLDKSFKLAKNIDLTGYDQTNGAHPIGSDNNNLPFNGTFDGAGFTISGFTYTGAGDSIGLFSLLGGGAVVLNLNMTGVQVARTDASPVGALAGDSGDASAAAIRIVHCSVSGSVQGGGGLSAGVGGLVGAMNGGGAGSIEILNSSSSVSVQSASPDGTGGLLGKCGQSTCTITNSYNTGDVSGVRWVGGLIGQGWGFDTDLISNSYSSGAITAGTDGGAGGLVGVSSWRLSVGQSFSTGNVVCNASHGATSGLACGAILGDTNTSGTRAITNASYFSGATYSNDGGAGVSNGLSGISAQGTLSWFYDPSDAPLSSWDFASTWLSQLGSGRLPSLR